jgi:hypothetical protein
MTAIAMYEALKSYMTQNEIFAPAMIAWKSFICSAAEPTTGDANDPSMLPVKFL